MSGPAVAGPPGYRIVQTIGHGASSTVYEAVQVSTGRRVALKVVATSTPGGDAERLYTRERAVLATLGGHPHIVSIVDAGDWDGRFWLAMEHCPYGSVVQPGDRLSVQDAVALLVGIGSALEVAHRAGLAHCDVKPANILRNQYGSPALADFGIAKFVLATGQGSTATGYTLDHASPEVLDGERPTGASDVYSLGTTVWEVLEGHPPFRRSGEVAQSAVIRRICFDPTPHLTRSDVPTELQALIAEMTQKSPADRPALSEIVARAQALQAVVGAPDPDRWARTIVAPLSTEHIAPRAGSPLGRERPETSARPSLDELTNYRPGALRECAPPVAAPEAPARRFRAWPVVAASVLAILLLGSGSVVTWRFANAESAPVTSASAPSGTTSESPSAASPPSSSPDAAVPYDGGGGATGGDEGGGYGGGYAGGEGSVGSADDPTASGSSDSASSGSDSDPASAADGTTDETGGDREAGHTEGGDVPDGSTDGAGTTSEQQPTAPIASVKIVEPTCQPTSGSSCTATTGRISFKLKVTDTQGNLITEDCQVSASVTKSGGSTRHGSGACTKKLQFDAGGAGTYTVRVKVTARGGTTPQEFTVRVQ